MKQHCNSGCWRLGTELTARSMRVLRNTMCVCWRGQEAEEQRVADEVELQAWATDAPAVLAAVLAAHPELEDPIAKVHTMLSILSYISMQSTINLNLPAALKSALPMPWSC